VKYPNHILLDIKTVSNNQVTKRTHTKPNPKNVKVSESLSYSTVREGIKPAVGVKAGTTAAPNSTAALLNTLFDINFLRKERMYTKLKYSRCPQYDIVSGGVAALLAGFIGFLITEKFGIELVDSGDFYMALMYAVIFGLALRPLLKVMNKGTSLIDLVSLK